MTASSTPGEIGAEGEQMTELNSSSHDLAGRLESLLAKATPGPWRWEVSLAAKQVELCGGPPKSGFGKYDQTIMSFRRWGTNSAAPVFWSWDGMFGSPRRADECSVPVPGREHHARWVRDIEDVNAQLMVAAVNALPQLLAERAQQAAEVERLKEALEPFAAAVAELDDVPADWRADDDMPVEDAFWKHQQPTVGDLRRARTALAAEAEVSRLKGAPKPVTGFIAMLTPEQRAAALAYTGDDTHGPAPTLIGEGEPQATDKECG